MALFGAWTGAIEFTNNAKFCLTCHVMRDTIAVEYQYSNHLKNACAVVVSCRDCHVPPYSWTSEVVI